MSRIVSGPSAGFLFPAAKSNHAGSIPSHHLRYPTPSYPSLLKPSTQPVKEQVNHGRSKQRQSLRNNQPANNRDSERPPHLAAGATPKRQRQAAQRRRPPFSSIF